MERKGREGEGNQGKRKGRNEEVESGVKGKGENGNIGKWIKREGRIREDAEEGMI